MEEDKGRNSRNRGKKKRWLKIKFESLGVMAHTYNHCIGRKGRILGWRNETNQGLIYAYMEMSQWNTLHNYHIILKIFLNK
jgi:hypothetical protein